ncbi:MAG: hypothetical protein QMC78_03420 [Methanocellales archaeon]|nr:hypothetical protein [Methanocellales archaeon]
MVSELEESISKLEELGRVSDEALVAEYVKQELQQLKSNVEGLDAHPGIKNSLLVKLDAASNKNDQALQFLLDGKEKQANNMLKATSNILDAFINEVGALSDKKIAEEDAKSLVQQAEKIIESIEEGAQWIIKEKVLVEVISRPEILAEIDENIADIYKIIAELQVLGAQIEVVVVDHEARLVVSASPIVWTVVIGVAAKSLLTAYGTVIILEYVFGPICFWHELGIFTIGVVVSAAA